MTCPWNLDRAALVFLLSRPSLTLLCGCLRFFSLIPHLHFRLRLGRIVKRELRFTQIEENEQATLEKFAELRGVQP